MTKCNIKGPILNWSQRTTLRTIYHYSNYLKADERKWSTSWSSQECVEEISFSNNTPKINRQENNGIQWAKIGLEVNSRNVHEDASKLLTNKKKVNKDIIKLPINMKHVNKDIVKRPTNTKHVNKGVMVHPTY